MIDQQHSTAASNLVAIDIAKDWNVALVQDTLGRRHRFKFANRGADHDHFVQFLHSLPGTVRIGLEPTGDYHRPIAHRLLREGFQVVSISSLALARFREARFGTWHYDWMEAITRPMVPHNSHPALNHPHIWVGPVMSASGKVAPPMLGRLGWQEDAFNPGGCQDCLKLLGKQGNPGRGSRTVCGQESRRLHPLGSERCGPNRQVAWQCQRLGRHHVRVG